jgi:hypothetical protein
MQGTANREQRTGWLLLGLMLVAMPVRAQDISFGGVTAKKAHVVLLSDGVDVAAGKVQFVELRFRVEPGFHINSHAPKDPLLIATVLKLDAKSGVDVQGLEYPKGAAFRLGQGADAQTLDVYQGEFRVRVKMVADAGNSTMSGVLHYQACDDASCFPPKNLDVKVAVTGK